MLSAGTSHSPEEFAKALPRIATIGTCGSQDLRAFVRANVVNSAIGQIQVCESSTRRSWFRWDSASP